MDVLPRAMDWLTNSHDTGISSKAIMSVMLGTLPDRVDCYPHDPSDLGRCLRLLDRIPEWKPRIGEMAKVGKVWARMAERWADLEASFLSEAGSLNPSGGSAPKTYDLMQQLQGR